MKAKKKFETDDYKIERRGNRTFAIATSPSGCNAYRIVKKPE